MQATHKEIYKRCSEDYNIPIEDVKLIGDVVFKEWNRKLKSPKSIILKIKKLGKMYLRKNKLEESILWHIDKIKNGEYETDETRANKEQLVALYTERLKEYGTYIEKKKEVQKIRYKTQIELQLTPEEE